VHGFDPELNHSPLTCLCEEEEQKSMGDQASRQIAMTAVAYQSPSFSLNRIIERDSFSPSLGPDRAHTPLSPSPARGAHKS
jgi:hypothetical protein